MDLVVTGPVWWWRGPSPYHFVTVGEDEARALAQVAPLVSYGWGMVPVTGRLGASAFRTALWPKDGGYVLPLKAAVRRAEGVGLDDLVTVHLHVEVDVR